MKNNKSKIIRFIPVIEKQAEKNLENLIKKAKSSFAFGNIPWEEPAWNITESQSKDRGHKQRQYWLWFTKHAKNKVIAKVGEPFQEPFANFSKAFIRLRHEIGGQSCSNHMNTIRAFRYLYNELKDQEYNPILLSRDHFIRAEQAAKVREATSTAYRMGVHLSEIARLLDENRLTKIRYWPEKGAEPRIKWLTTEAGPLVKKIIEELLEFTAEARATADWLEKHPGKVYLATHKTNDLINMDDVAKLLNIQNAHQFCRIRNLPLIKSFENQEYWVKWVDLEKALVVQRWDKPMLKLKSGKTQPLSKSLCVVFFEQLGNQRPQKKWIVRPISEQNISDFLCSRTVIKSVFERFGYVTSDGTPYKIRTQQFRHFLNTIANEGGLTDIELAWWFGRKHISDNQAYDHRTAVQMTEKARQMLLSGEIIGPIADAAKQLTPIEAKDFVATQVNAVHHTPYGLCLHDFAQNPCDKHLNCLSGCKEFHRIKGNQTERDNLKTLKAQVSTALDQAKKEVTDETWGANNWVNHNETILENVEKALAIDTDNHETTNTLVPVTPSGKVFGEPL